MYFLEDLDEEEYEIAIKVCKAGKKRYFLGVPNDDLLVKLDSIIPLVRNTLTCSLAKTQWAKISILVALKLNFSYSVSPKMFTFISRLDFQITILFLMRLNSEFFLSMQWGTIFKRELVTLVCLISIAVRLFFKEIFSAQYALM